MKRVLKTILLIAMLCCYSWGAITFHATTNNIAGSGTTLAITLPTVSNNDYVVCATVANGTGATPGSTNLPPFDTPAGWTNLYDLGYLEIIGLVWTTGGPTSVTFTAQNGATASFAGGCISYTGVDTSTPIDGVPNVCVPCWDSNQGTAYSILYPSVSPTFTNDWAISIGWIPQSSGQNPGDPSGFTNRVFRNGAGAIKIDDSALGSGAATGNLITTPTGGGTSSVFGSALFLLHAAGGSSATTAVWPTFGGMQANCSNFNTMYPVTGDLIGVVTYGAGTGTSISGFTKVFQTADVGFYTLPWTSGGTTTITLSGQDLDTACETIIVRNYNPSGRTLVRPTVDAFGTTAATAGSTSLASSSIAVNSSQDLLLVLWSSGHSGGGNGNGWTLSASLQSVLVAKLTSNIVTVAEGFLQPPSNPTGTFTSTIAASQILGSGSITFILGSSRSNSFPMIVKNYIPDELYLHTLE